MALIPAEYFENAAREKMEQLFDQLEAADKVLPSARSDFVMRSVEFGTINGQFCHLESGLPAATWAEQWLMERPHASAERLKITSEAEAAWGAHPTLAARGRRLKEIGLYGAKAECAAWGAEWNTLKPGTPPESKEKTEKEKHTPAGAKNPFKQLRNADGSINKVAEAKVAELIKISTKFAAEMAKAAGVSLDGRPLRQ